MRTYRLVAPLAIACLASAQDAYLIDPVLDQLFTVDLATGATTLIGSTFHFYLPSPAGLTWRAATGQLWTVDNLTGRVGTLDVTTGAFTPHYDTHQGGWTAIAWDERMQRFYLARGGDLYVLTPGASWLFSQGASINALDTDACGNLFGIATNQAHQQAYQIDTTTGAQTLLSSTTNGSFHGLGIDHVTGAWFASEMLTDRLYDYNPSTGVTAPIGPYGNNIVWGRGFDLVEPVDRPRAYLVDVVGNNDADLFAVDLFSGAASHIASVVNNGLQAPADLTWRAATRELWTIDYAGGDVGTIDTITGTFTPFYQTNTTGWQGFAWDEVTQKFYLSHQNYRTYVLDPATGVTTLLGTSAFQVWCLDTDSSGNLFGIAVTGQVAQVDKTTGVATQLAMTIAGFQGLGIDQLTGAWFGANSNDDSLHSVDPSGTHTLIGPYGANVVYSKGFDLVDPTITFGTGCGGVNLAPLSHPALCGNWDLDLTLPPAATLGALAIGFSNPNFSLSPFGAPGCTQYVNNVILVILPLPLNSPAYSLTMPSRPAYVGLPLFAQGFGLVPGLNALNVGASNGVHGRAVNF